MADGDSGQGQASGAGATGQGQAPTGQQTGQQGSQAGTSGQGNGQQQDGATGQQQGQQQGTADGMPDLSTITDPHLRAWVEAQAREAREARQEAGRYRTERNGLRTQFDQYRQQHETDEQRQQREAQEARQRLEALEAENRTLKIAPQFTAAATAAKALDPQALLTLVGGLEAITLDDQGKATNLDALLAQARTQYPYMFSRTNADAQQTGDGQAASGGMNDFIRGRAAAR